ncbi:MAG: homoserine dehydrogenase [Myxococcaceae bacterium]
MKPVRIGLLGLGNVGGVVARELLQRQNLLEKAAGTPLVLQRVAVREPQKHRGATGPALDTDPMRVACADDVDVVVELMGGLEPARSVVQAALEHQKSVVTANKRLLAWHGDALTALAARRHVDLRYEASVGGGIPLLAPLEDDLAANRVLELRAIINGTTNYILTQMASGTSFATALADAQARGFAEADPTADVDAIDAVDKLALLVRIAFGVRCTPDALFREGIRELDVKDLALGKELGYVLKLIASARRTPEGVEARVHPAFLPQSHPLARIDGAQNAVQVIGDLSGPVMFSGQGAGGEATASAVLADVVHIARRMAMGVPPSVPRSPQTDERLRPMADVRTRCYFRLAVDDVPGVFAQLTQVLAAHHIGLASVLQREPFKQGAAEVVLLTYEAPESALAQAEVELAQLPCTRAVRARIRVDAPDSQGMASGVTP